MLFCGVPRAMLPKKHIAVLWTLMAKVTHAATMSPSHRLHESHLPQSKATHLGSMQGAFVGAAEAASCHRSVLECCTVCQPVL